MKCKNVGTLETLARHVEQQFLTPVRIKKTKKYETFFSYGNSSSKIFVIALRSFYYCKSNSKYTVFSPTHSGEKFVWIWSQIWMFEWVFQTFIKCFIFFRFFLLEPVSKIVPPYVLPMFLASPHSCISLFTENVTGYWNIPVY